MISYLVAYGWCAFGVAGGFLLAGLFRSAKVSDLHSAIAELEASAEHDAKLLRKFATDLTAYQRADRERTARLREAGRKGALATNAKKAAK